MYSRKQLMRAAEDLHDYCFILRESGKSCKGCLFYNAYPYGRCCISGPAAWPMMRIKEEYNNAIKKWKSPASF